MTPLPGALGGRVLIAWRLDSARYAPTWDSGEGAYQAGGRWNSKGRRVVYAALDPATAILEVAVHKGFAALDAVAHVITGFAIDDPSLVHVVDSGAAPNPNWWRPGIPSAGQQAFGDRLIADHRFVVLPSTVSPRSWNVLFAPEPAVGLYRMVSQEPFALDGRLNPP